MILLFYYIRILLFLFKLLLFEALVYDFMSSRWNSITSFWLGRWGDCIHYNWEFLRLLFLCYDWIFWFELLRVVTGIWHSVFLPLVLGKPEKFVVTCGIKLNDISKFGSFISSSILFITFFFLIFGLIFPWHYPQGSQYAFIFYPFYNLFIKWMVGTEVIFQFFTLKTFRI